MRNEENWGTLSIVCGVLLHSAFFLRSCRSEVKLQHVIRDQGSASDSFNTPNLQVSFDCVPHFYKLQTNIVFANEAIIINFSKIANQFTFHADLKSKGLYAKWHGNKNCLDVKCSNHNSSGWQRQKQKTNLQKRFDGRLRRFLGSTPPPTKQGQRGRVVPPHRRIESEPQLLADRF